MPAREALVQLAQRIPLPELNFVVTAMLLQRETGGNLVEVLDRTTAVIRERLRIQGEIRIYTAQGRLTGWILSLLPIAMFFLAGTGQPRLHPGADRRPDGPQAGVSPAWA